MHQHRVVVTGIGVIAPNGIGKDAYWDALERGKSGIKRITGFDPEGLSCKIAGEVTDFNPLAYLDPKKSRRMARHTQFAVSGVRMAITDAGVDIHAIPENDGLLAFGVSTSAMDLIENQMKVLMKHGYRRIVPYGLVAATPHRVMGEILEHLAWKPRTILLTAACVSGLDAIGTAFTRIRNGEVKFAIAGGAEAAITPLTMGGLCAGGLMPEFNDHPEQASRPFDKYRCGGVLSEGCGVVTLEDRDYAMARGAHIYGEISGYGSAGDGYVEPGMHAAGLKDAILRTLDDANLSPKAIEAVAAHGPSDPLIDLVETDFLKEVFGAHAYNVPVSSIKSMVGNPFGCAGPLQLIAVMLWFAKDIVTPTINYDFPDPECDLYYVPNIAQPLRVSTVLLDCSGLGGTCSSLICKRSEL